MPSTLTWLDHDSAAQERSLRILQLFQERDTRDELGIGAVRDGLADLLFPGTSTIQTRLRYMLFVPWIYQALEERRVPPHEMAAQGRRRETELIEHLLKSDDLAGIIGSDARANLKRLPSSVYWNGLAVWGIRCFVGSQADYHRWIGEIYARRHSRAALDDDPASPDPATVTWSTSLPPRPERFPIGSSFALTPLEASFLRDRIAVSNPESLLAHLVRHAASAEVPFIWEHPDYADFRPDHRSLVDEARRLSETMHGAALLYNLMLAERRAAGESGGERSELVSTYRARYADWARSTDMRELRRWKTEVLWASLAAHPSVRVSFATRRFIEYWIEVAATRAQVAVDDDAVRLALQHRERALKGSQARLFSQAALDRWGGQSGLRRLDYRWSITQTFLRDLSAGLARAASDSAEAAVGDDARP